MSARLRAATDFAGAGPLADAELIDDAIILPASLTAKYRFDLAGGIKPYLGAGRAYFMTFSVIRGLSAPVSPIASDE